MMTARGLIMLGMLGLTAGVAAGASDHAHIDSDKALKRITGHWYDSDSGGYRPPVLPKPIDDNIRRSGWLGAPPKPKAASTTAPNRTWASLGLTSEVFGWLVFSFLGIGLLVGVLAIAYSYFGEYIPALKRKSDSKDATKIDTARIEDLPFEVPVVSNDPLSQAEALMRMGRYNEAVVYLYGYMLLALDQARKIHLQRGKTNRMYLRELRGETQLQGITHKTMLAFEDVFFGRHDIDRTRFESLWQQREEFHRLIRPAEIPEVSAAGKAAAV